MTRTEAEEGASLQTRLRRALQAAPTRAPFVEIGIGVAAALAAVAVRAALPLGPQQLPTITVVFTLAIVTTFVGARAGVACALLGGLLCWYLFVNPRSWSLAHGAWIPLVGFAVIAAVIVSTAHLYRSSERLRHQRELAIVEAQAANAQLFAGELAHRLKNALAIVQAIAVQTMDPKSPDTTKFANRIKALADANDLLSKHVSMPVASVTDVIEEAVRPFRDREDRFEVVSIEALLPAQHVVSLALALHELATNAVKYGSLSRSEGRVAITVTDAGDRLTLTWHEHGGPPVAQPARSGFGTRLLHRAGLDTQLDYAPAGVRCALGIRKA